MTDLPRDIRYDTVFSFLDEMEDQAKSQLVEKTPWYMSKKAKADRLDGITSRFKSIQDLRDRLEIYRMEKSARRG